MAVQNSLQKANQRLGLSAYLTKDAVRDQINKVVGGKDGQRFISAIVSATTVNSTLQECTNQSILSAALLGESLKLSPSPQLGHYYLVPFNDKEKGKVAQFQLGYKGYIQLAMRSSQYLDIDATEVKEGEYKGRDKKTGRPTIEFIEDDDEREKLPTVGYTAYFELLNGFTKRIYWSKSKMDAHAMKYSQGYRNDKLKGTAYTFWSKDFDGMAYKTMLRQLISKWGIMSVEMQLAYESDMAVINEDGSKSYVETDDDSVVIDAEVVEVKSEKEEKTESSANDAQTALFG